MKKAIFCCLMSALLWCCSDGHYTHKAAREAAEKYYTMLVRGDYKGFVDGYASSENLPEDFRSQLVDATAQFMARDDMRRLVSVEALSDSLLEDSTAYVMLQLHFADSTSEQVELSLVLEEGKWRMQ
ncbi:MAG: hypothetical protein IJ219_10485 [Bacteroidaceae bacterium]|nr:hypothetical protein [Bacteroidaceae bacterium]MBQ9295334.1 hypothetical protein [Bacteroidaceae bacterium]